MAAKVNPPSHLVVIGSSAGGIDALSTLVATLPSEFPAPIVIAQHLDPTRPSHLGDILARRSTLPVRTAEDHEPLEPGVIYTVPSNRQVQIRDGQVQLQAAETARVKPSIDALFSSAAEAYGDRLIAVILSGTGSDGAAGARMVKKAGGTVMIQDPDTASYPGMPLALAPTTVDIVATLDRMGSILFDLLRGMEVPTQPETKQALEQFLEELRERAGIDFSSYKMPTILRRLQRRILATATTDLDGYVHYLNTHPQEYQQLINTLLIKVTEFFRDPDLFAYVRTEVLPDLIAHAEQGGREIRIWSAGCATGEEAYSLAMLVSEALGEQMEQYHVRIFATDVDADAVAFARRGTYPSSALTDLSEEVLERYFTRTDGAYGIKKAVRALVVFGQHDLGQRAPFPNVDLVVCRNVLIYFTPELQRRTLHLFAYSLRDGGYLVLGKAESTSPLAESFVLQHKQHKVYRRQGERVLVPATRFTAPVTPLPPKKTLPKRTLSPPALPQPPKEAPHIRSISEAFLRRIPVGLVVVNRQYDIQTINSTARAYLAIHGSAIGEDVVHLAQGIPDKLLLSTLSRAFQSGEPTSIDEVVVEEVTTGEPRYLQIRCQPQRSEGERGPVDAVLLVIQDVTPFVEERQRLAQQVRDLNADLERVKQEAATELERREDVARRVAQTYRQVLEANQELTSTNEELRSANEEFLVNTEEAQAATEEVETLNEELQATNEELETLNEELQSTIEELNTTNDDLHARSQELQDLASTSEEARGRLEAILANNPSALLVVNTAGELVMTNPAYAEMFGGPKATILALDEAGHLLPPEALPRERAARGESFRMEFTLTAEDGSRRWFEAIGQPIREPGQQGGVVAIRDITDRSLQRLQEEFMAQASHELRTPLTSLKGELQLHLKRLAEQSVDAPVHRSAERALSQVQRLQRLVEDLLDVTRLHNGKYRLELAPLQLEDLAEQAKEEAQALTTSQTITLEVSGAPVRVLGDAGRLEQVLMNLLTNAIAYAQSSRQIEVRLRRVGNEAELQVQDTGPGIPPEELPQLFSRFYQATRRNRQGKRGLGLGLYIAREIVTAHGGQIEVESVQGQGTTFTVRLPLLPNEEPAETGEAPGTGEPN